MAAFSAPERSVIASDDRPLHAAVAAYLGRYRGQSRLHTGSDANDDLYLTVADIARAARVTVRAVQLAFRRHLDTHPWPTYA